MEFITESRKKLALFLVALYACQDCHLSTVDNSEVNPPAVMRTDQLSESYLCQNANRTMGNSDMNYNDFWVEPLEQKNCAGQIHNQLRLWLNVRTVDIYNFGKTMSQNPDPQWSSNRTVLSESWRLGAVTSLVPQPDKSGLPSKSVLPEPWAWRPDSVTPLKIQNLRVKNGLRFFSLKRLDVQLTPSIVVHCALVQRRRSATSTWDSLPDRAAIPSTETSPKTGHYITNGVPSHFECPLHCADSPHVRKGFGRLYAFEMAEMFVVLPQLHVTATSLGSGWYFRKSATSTAEGGRVYLKRSRQSCCLSHRCRDLSLVALVVVMCL